MGHYIKPRADNRADKVMNVTVAQLSTWLQEINFDASTPLTLLVGDASSRQYYRCQQAERSYLIMVSGLEPTALRNFIAVDRAWTALQLKVPTIYAENHSLHCLLLEDFGDNLYNSILIEQNMEALYGKALAALATIQTCGAIPGHTMINFLDEICLRDLMIWREWFVEKLCAYSLNEAERQELDHFFTLLQTQAAAQPQVCIHRDYHSRNLLAVDNDVGIIDFQDAMWGPVCYDVVSLLRDCYRVWPAAQVEKLLRQFYRLIGDRHPHFSEADFMTACDWMGLQRHLKALGTFARKIKRDNDERYRTAIPATLNYILPVLEKYSELKSIKKLLEQICIKQP